MLGEKKKKKSLVHVAYIQMHVNSSWTKQALGWNLKLFKAPKT